MLPASTSSLLADRLHGLGESQTLAMTVRARALRAQGFPIINLSLGEPDFPTAPHIREAAKQAIDEGNSWYTPVAGTLELRQAIADKLRRENNISWNPENILVSTGAKQALANVILALVNPGDEVLIFAPYWLTYHELVQLAGGVPVLLEGSYANQLKATAADLSDAITPRTKLVVYSSPCNPTGAIFSREELTQMARVVARHPRVLVVADEIYEHIRFQEEYFSMASLDFVREQVITVNGFSKGYAMTGWRVGYLAAARWIVEACNAVQGQVTSGPCAISQKAAVAALTGTQEPVRAMQEVYRRRRDLVMELLGAIPHLPVDEPAGAFFLLPDVSYYLGREVSGQRLATAQDLCAWLLEEAHVALVTGAPFGAPTCIRLSYATSEENLRQALPRLRTTLAALVGHPQEACYL
ncbi:pyridoxal phosphate-dependent aminotransferase [Hymenobacter aquaticus]|uniref:Aminotransferase n=1 Tax=Hymenobacter aquaticus TaxID=1867101 RepID=A0A4Z0PYF4_9BACT|nr:pyridoxal phosphate-dependent aminotransferase [Hymenobacter aquaticus]TGE21492.1 pyridoxal phosphate-dependent aminotransferase [Hymenobacter aquaticus]